MSWWRWGHNHDDYDKAGQYDDDDDASDDDDDVDDDKDEGNDDEENAGHVAWVIMFWACFLPCL